MLKKSENNGTEEIGLVTPTPGLLETALNKNLPRKASNDSATAICHVCINNSSTCGQPCGSAYERNTVP